MVMLIHGTQKMMMLSRNPEKVEKAASVFFLSSVSGKKNTTSCGEIGLIWNGVDLQVATRGIIVVLRGYELVVHQAHHDE